VTTPFHVRRDPAFFDVYKRVKVRTATEAVAIDRARKVVLVRDVNTGSEEELAYDKLVVATGSKPFVPPVEGVDLPGVHVVANLAHAEAIKGSLGGVDQAVVVGAGAIGIEMAEALTDLWGVETTVVEMMEHILPQALGREIATAATRELEANDVTVLCGERVSRIVGDENGVTAVETASGKHLPCQMVIFGAGSRANAELAKQAGLAVGRFGGIIVDERMRTSDPDIYAGGDCVEVMHLVSGERVNMPLGSLANRQGRVIGSNLAGKPDRFPGVIGTFTIKIFEQGVARAGLTARQAQAAGFDPVEAVVVQADRAHFFPTKNMMTMKLIVDRSTRAVLGTEAIGAGGDAVKARVDAVAALLMRGADVEEVSNLEVGYAPPFASAMDIVNTAGNAARNILDGLVETMEINDFVRRLLAGELSVVDVRAESEAAPYKAKFGDHWVNIPQEQLCDRLDEIPDGEVVMFCNTGLRSYESKLLLCERGVKANMCNVPGGHWLLNLVEPEFTGPAGGSAQ
jgi:NADPH-dependent 2,4-dienoyl-CoA reductase/sulfur reductase-like enzyme/rhodanese-related sulfurtransferase